MKTTILKYIARSIIAATLLLGGCSGDPAGLSEADANRLAALEAEVKSLRQEARTRETALKQELASVHKSLEAIENLIRLERQGGGTRPEGQPESDRPSEPKQELDEKAKAFVDENLDKLLSITKKLLDSMEKEIDKHLTKQPPVPEGDQI